MAEWVGVPGQRRLIDAGICAVVYRHPNGQMILCGERQLTTHEHAENDKPDCICGHVRLHHRALGPMNPLAETACEWRGCGCPRHVPRAGDDRG